MKQKIKISGVYVETINPLTKEVLHKGKFYEDWTADDLMEIEVDLPKNIEQELVEIVKTIFDGIDEIDDIYGDREFYQDGYEFQIFRYVEEERIINKEMDYFSVQRHVDGFGNDTYTNACFPTYEEAVKYANEYGGTVVPQKWGEFYNKF